MPRRLPEYQARVGVSGGDRTAVTSAQPVQSGLEAGIGLARDITAAAFEITKQRDTARMLKQISDINIQTTQRMAELSVHGTGDRPFAEVAVEEFTNQANSFIAAQPAYLRDAARQKMLSMKDSVAGQAIAMQSSLAAQELARETDAFNNNLTNMVMIGQLSEADALSQANEYVQSLPELARAGATDDLRSNILMASLQRQIENNPQQALQEIRSRRYNELRPNRLQNLMNEANRRIEAQMSATIKRQNEIIKERFTDPASAAYKSFLDSGVPVDDVSPDDLLLWQSQNGVHKDNQSLLTRERVNEMWLQAGPAIENTVTGAWGFVNGIYNGYVNKEHAKIAVNDFIRYADAPVEFKQVMSAYIDVEGNIAALPERQQQNLEYQLRTIGRDRETANAFNAALGGSDANSDRSDFDQDFMDKVSVSAFRAGENVENLTQQMDIARRVYQQARLDGHSGRKAREIAMGKFEDLVKIDNMLLPPDIAEMWRLPREFNQIPDLPSMPITSPMIGIAVMPITSPRTRQESIVKAAIGRDIESRNLIVPFGIDEDIFYRDLNNFQWVNGIGRRDNQPYLRLVYSGEGGGLSPVYRRTPDGDSQEVYVTYNVLRPLLEDM